MLTSLILQLTSPEKMTLPASLGRAGMALFLRLVGEQDATFAQELHDYNGLKPFTVSNLVLGKRRAGELHIEAGQQGWLRFTGLTEQVSQYLISLADSPPETVELDHHNFIVSGATLDPAVHRWAGQGSYQDLAAPFLLAKQRNISHQIKMEFSSSTTFKSDGRFMPLPLPELVFGSLLNRWQQFAPIALSPDIHRFAKEAMALSRYDIRTRSTIYKQGEHKMRKIGFMGQVTFVALNRDRYWLNMLHLLAAYAFYSGVGMQTSAGLGQVRGF